MAWLAGTEPMRVAVCLPITPQTQWRSSAVSWLPHLFSIMLAAPSASVVAILISASTIISLRTLVMAICLVARNFAGLLLSSVTSPIDSGETILTASRAARGRFASVARRAFRHTSRPLKCCVPISREAAAVQPSSASRCENQFFLTSSAIPGWAAGPLFKLSTSSA